MEAVKRKRRCEIQCQQHLFSIKNLKNNPKYDISLTFCPKYQRQPLPPQHTFAEYNNDGFYYTSAFVLGIDKKTVAKNLQREMLDHNKLVKENLQKYNQIIFPRPNSKHTTCSVCKQQYTNYYIHIFSDQHSQKIHLSAYNKQIKNLCELFLPLWEGCEEKADQNDQQRRFNQKIEAQKRQKQQLNLNDILEEEQINNDPEVYISKMEQQQSYQKQVVMLRKMPSARDSRVSMTTQRNNSLYPKQKQYENRQSRKKNIKFTQFFQDYPNPSKKVVTDHRQAVSTNHHKIPRDSNYRLQRPIYEKKHSHQQIPTFSGKRFTEPLIGFHHGYVNNLLAKNKESSAKKNALIAKIYDDPFQIEYNARQAKKKEKKSYYHIKKRQRELKQLQRRKNEQRQLLQNMNNNNNNENNNIGNTNPLLGCNNPSPSVLSYQKKPQLSSKGKVRTPSSSNPNTNKPKQIVQILDSSSSQNGCDLQQKQIQQLPFLDVNNMNPPNLHPHHHLLNQQQFSSQNLMSHLEKRERTAQLFSSSSNPHKNSGLHSINNPNNYFDFNLNQSQKQQEQEQEEDQNMNYDSYFAFKEQHMRMSNENSMLQEEEQGDIGGVGGEGFDILNTNNNTNNNNTGNCMYELLNVVGSNNNPNPNSSINKSKTNSSNNPNKNNNSNIKASSSNSKEPKGKNATTSTHNNPDNEMSSNSKNTYNIRNRSNNNNSYRYNNNNYNYHDNDHYNKNSKSDNRSGNNNNNSNNNNKDIKKTFSRDIDLFEEVSKKPIASIDPSHSKEKISDKQKQGSHSSSTIMYELAPPRPQKPSRRSSHKHQDDSYEPPARLNLNNNINKQPPAPSVKGDDQLSKEFVHNIKNPLQKGFSSSGVEEVPLRRHRLSDVANKGKGGNGGGNGNGNENDNVEQFKAQLSQSFYQEYENKYKQYQQKEREKALNKNNNSYNNINNSHSKNNSLINEGSGNNNDNSNMLYDLYNIKSDKSSHNAYRTLSNNNNNTKNNDGVSNNNLVNTNNSHTHSRHHHQQQHHRNPINNEYEQPSSVASSRQQQQQQQDINGNYKISMPPNNLNNSVNSLNSGNPTANTLKQQQFYPPPPHLYMKSDEEKAYYMHNNPSSNSSNNNSAKPSNNNLYQPFDKKSVSPVDPYMPGGGFSNSGGYYNREGINNEYYRKHTPSQHHKQHNINMPYLTNTPNKEEDLLITSKQLLNPNNISNNSNPHSINSINKAYDASIHTPGHTPGHTPYYPSSSSSHAASNWPGYYPPPPIIANSALTSPMPSLSIGGGRRGQTDQGMTKFGMEDNNSNPNNNRSSSSNDKKIQRPYYPNNYPHHHSIPPNHQQYPPNQSRITTPSNTSININFPMYMHPSYHHMVPYPPNSNPHYHLPNPYDQPQNISSHYSVPGVGGSGYGGGGGQSSNLLPYAEYQEFKKRESERNQRGQRNQRSERGQNNNNNNNNRR